MKQRFDFLIFILFILASLIHANDTEKGYIVLRDFEEGVQNWIVSSLTHTGKPAVKEISGRKALVLRVEFPAPVQLYKIRRMPGILGEIRHIKLELYIPKEARDVEVSFFAKDKDGLWFQTISSDRIISGTWNEALFDITREGTRVFPDGHFGTWEETAVGRTIALGFQIYSRKAFKGAIGVSRILGAPDEQSLKDCRIIELQIPKKKVPLYEKFEVIFNLTKEFSNPFDPEKVRVWSEFIIPGEKAIEIPCFFYRDYIRTWNEKKSEEVLLRKGAGVWKLRYSPLHEGVYRFQLNVDDGSTAVKSSWYGFTAIAPESPGFIHVDNNDNRYFSFSDSTLFYPIGHNVRSPNDPRCANVLGMEISPDRGTFAYDDYFKRMSEAGENLIEIWMCSWWVGLEWIEKWRFYHGLGYYNMQNAWKLDYLLDLAEKYDMYIHLIIDNHGKLSINCDPEWALSPYHVKNGGFLSHPNEYFKSEKAKKLYKKKLRYILARWGWSRRIMGFELWSELDLVGKKVHKTDDVYKWHSEIADIIHRYPVPRLVTTHYSGDYKVVDPKMAALKEIDYVAGDGYRERGIFPDLAKKTSVRYRTFKKPGFITEYGGSWNGTTEAGLRADLHAGIWSSFLTDAAGIPLFWWFGFVDKENLYYHYKAFSEFIKGEDKRGRDLKNIPVSISGRDNSYLDTMSAVDKNGGYIWIYSRKYMKEYPANLKEIRYIKNIILSIAVPEEGKHLIEIWDTVKGIPIYKETVETENKRLVVSLPDFKIDCALKIKREQNGR